MNLSSSVEQPSKMPSGARRFFVRRDDFASALCPGRDRRWASHFVCFRGGREIGVVRDHGLHLDEIDACAFRESTAATAVSGVVTAMELGKRNFAIGRLHPAWGPKRSSVADDLVSCDCLRQAASTGKSPPYREPR